MADPPASPIRLELDLAADQPGLLEGLEVWLGLGLLSETQVLALAQTHLVCDLPPQPSPAIEPELDPAPSSDLPVSTAVPGIPDFLPADADEEAIFRSLPPPPSPRRLPTQQGTPRPSTTASGPPGSAPRPQAPPSVAPGRWVSRLMGELSVVWLLGLGVFLVVLSSAVLAATQWARFNAVGQYLVLLTYTLAFWGVGLGCGRQTNLNLTAKTLGIITLLLVPLNFWAMDRLGLWAMPGGLWLGLAATAVLSLVTLREVRQQQGTLLEQGNALGLAYLHTGWGWAGMPLLAVYLGVVGSGLVTLFRTLHRQRRPTTDPPKLPLPTLTLGVSLGLLLLRALTLIPATQWGQFGLAFGLYAATWIWLGQRQLSAPPPPLSPSPPASPPRLRWPLLLNRLLLGGSWLLTLGNWLAQALALSTLGLGLRIQALGKLGKRRDLLVAYGIAVQLSFVAWDLLPYDLRQQAIHGLASRTGAGGWPTALLGISLFPYVVGMVALGDWYHRRQRPQLGRFSDGIALGSNLLLTLVSIPVGRVLVVNLIASTVTAFVVAGRRTPRHQGRIVLSYGLTLATILVTLGQRWPQLLLPHWLTVVTALAVVAIGLSKLLPNLWGKSAWGYGLGLSAATYGLLWWYLLTHTTGLQSPWTILGLAIPLAFTLVGRPAASLPTTALALLYTLGMPWTRLVGLGTATLLAAANGYVLRQAIVPFLTVTYGLGLIVATVDYTIPAFPRHWTNWYGLTAVLTLLLWAVWRLLSVRSLYRTACDQWGHGLTLGLLTAMTVFPPWLLGDGDPPLPMPLIALGGLLLALALRYGGQIQPSTVYLAGWTMPLLVAEAMVWRWGSPLALAVPILGLGALALALATGLAGARPGLVAPLQRLTLVYAGLALVLRSYTATAWTGWIVVGAALLVLEVGRRRQQPLARWLALAGLSVGWYELVLYPLLQSPAGAMADGLILLAAVAALIMVVYRLAAGRIQADWGLPPQELLWAAHLHWFLGSGLVLGSGMLRVGARGTGTLVWGGVGLATALVVYALLQGRLAPRDSAKSAWVYGGLVELVGWFALVRQAAPALAGLDSGWGIVACGVGVPIYWIPWSRWGWPQRPWRVMAIAVPLIITPITQSLGHIPTLWVLVGFYGWLAWHSGRVRISYLSATLATLAVWRWLDQQSIHDSVVGVLPLSLALLYGAQVDPALKTEGARGLRHGLRVVAAGLVLFTALVAQRWTGWPVGGLSLGLVAAGLVLRIRAFLYVGTLVFALNGLNQLVLLNAVYPFMKWVIGILMGVALIWIAADFERRRAQWVHMTQTWLQDLEDWS